MRVKTIIDERFEDYKLPSMYIGCIYCDGKCAIEGGFPLSHCINEKWNETIIREFDDGEIIERYLRNRLTKAMVFGLLEPMCQFNEVYTFIKKLRQQYHCNDTVVIYTGYTEEECVQNSWLSQLEALGNVIVKFGRYIPGQTPHYDEILGVKLASDNQYAKLFGVKNESEL